MRAVVVRELGPPEVMRVESVNAPTPAPGRAVVDVAFAGVNFTDTERRRGLSDRTLPWIPGIEAAGTVAEVGEGVTADLLGARVALTGPATKQTGTYAERVAASVEHVYRIPDRVSLETAAAVLTQGLTAYHLVHTVGAVQPGQTVLVHAAAGGVGRLAVQLAQRAGARVLGATSRAEKAESIARLGAEPVVLDGDGRWVEAVRRAAAGRGADLVLDSVGAPTQAGSLAALAPFGHLVHFGSAGGTPEPVDPEVLYERSLRVSSYWLWAPHPPGEMVQAAETLFTLAAGGDLRADLDGILPLAEAPEAHRRLESGAARGKLLLACYPRHGATGWKGVP